MPNCNTERFIERLTKTTVKFYATALTFIIQVIVIN